MKFCFLLILFFTKTYAATEDEMLAKNRIIDYQMDWKYSAGDYLIFDCERGHYACVNEEGNTNCVEERNFVLEKKAKFYPCAPLGKFASKRSCIENSYKIVDINAPRRFCYPK